MNRKQEYESPLDARISRDRKLLKEKKRNLLLEIPLFLFALLRHPIVVGLILLFTLSQFEQFSIQIRLIVAGTVTAAYWFFKPA